MHIIFDINMDGDFTRKTISVVNFHTTAPPSFITYSSVVSRESVRISFLIASLNELFIFVCDIVNFYLNTKFKENLWIEGATKFGIEKGMITITPVLHKEQN